MRVVLAVGQLGLGGAEKQVTLLARGLQERGVDVQVACLFGTGPRERELATAGVPVHVARLPQLHDLGGGPLAFPRYVAWLRSVRPDVVHAFLYHAYITTVPAARLARVPVVVAGRRSLGAYKEGRRVALAVEQVVNRVTPLIVANSEAVKADVVASEHVPADKVVVIPNGLEPGAFVPAPPADFDTDRPVVLCVANLIDYKGHDFLLQAVARLDRPVTLLLAGDGARRSALAEQAVSLGVDARFLGARDDVPSLLAAADVVVLPSLHEGMSNVLLEAMAAAKPVVATRVGGNPETLGDTGLLVAPADPAALAAGITRLLDDNRLAKDLGEAARERAQRQFSSDAMVDRHVELYRSLLT